MKRSDFLNFYYFLLFIIFFTERQSLGYVTRNLHCHRVKYTDQTVWMICDRKDEALLLYHEKNFILYYNYIINSFFLFYPFKLFFFFAWHHFFLLIFLRIIWHFFRPLALNKPLFMQSFFYEMKILIVHIYNQT